MSQGEDSSIKTINNHTSTLCYVKWNRTEKDLYLRQDEQEGDKNISIVQHHNIYVKYLFPVKVEPANWNGQT